MYDGQRGSAVAGSALGRFDNAKASPVAVERPRIHSQLDQLAKVLTECHHCAASVESAADRLLGPGPQEAGDKAQQPPADTVEQKLQVAIDYAQALANRLSNASAKLNAAV